MQSSISTLYTIRTIINHYFTMAPKIFLTGATGYIGGDALYALYNKHSDYEIATLVRSGEWNLQS